MKFDKDVQWVSYRCDAIFYPICEKPVSSPTTIRRAATTYQYLSESPVKLLTADLIGNLYPASNSEFRVSSDGIDEDVDLSLYDMANGRPDQELVLQPGGEAVFLLPFQQDLQFLMVKPGKNVASDLPFANKANITVSAGQLDQKTEVSKLCHSPTHDSSPVASRYCILDLRQLQELSLQVVEVRIGHGTPSSGNYISVP